MNLGNSMICFGMDQNSQSVAVKEQSSCPCCCKHIVACSSSQPVQLNSMDNCDCGQSNLPIGNKEQINTSVFENIGLDKIVDISNTFSKLISFENKGLIAKYYLDYRSPLHCNLDKLSTIVLII
jgi:hypothetical protein